MSNRSRQRKSQRRNKSMKRGGFWPFSKDGIPAPKDQKAAAAAIVAAKPAETKTVTQQKKDALKAIDENIKKVQEEIDTTIPKKYKEDKEKLEKDTKEALDKKKIELKQLQANRKAQAGDLGFFSGLFA